MISIIIPIYNTELYLKKCLDSAINQIFSNIEILCVNDGSTDSSKQILEEYAAKDTRIKVLEQKHSGSAAARNLALKNATGEYLMFLDSDDYYEPEMCKEMFECMVSENTDVVNCDCNVIIESANHTRNNGDMLYLRLNCQGKLALDNDNINKINIILWNKIFKKKICDDYAITFPNGCEHDDASFVFQYLTVANSIFGLKKELYNYVLRENSVMYKINKNTNHNSKNDSWYSIRHTLNFLRRHSKLQEYAVSFHELFIKDTLWKWSYLTKEEQFSAANAIINIFTEDDLKLLKKHTSRPDLYKIIQKRNERYLINILNRKATILESIFSIRPTFEDYAIVRFLGFKFKIKVSKSLPNEDIQI